MVDPCYRVGGNAPLEWVELCHRVGGVIPLECVKYANRVAELCLRFSHTFRGFLRPIITSF